MLPENSSGECRRQTGSDPLGATLTLATVHGPVSPLPIFTRSPMFTTAVYMDNLVNVQLLSARPTYDAPR